MPKITDLEVSLARAEDLVGNEPNGLVLRPLSPEEDEPCFAALIDKAKARAAELAETGDGKLISDLIAAYEHADAMAHMIYWNASDNGQLPTGA